VLALLFFSCGPANNSSTESVVLTGNISEELVLDDLFEGFEYISLETLKESIFGEIRKLIIYDNRFYIHDSQLKKIFVFQADGTFVRTIGKIGRGAGEYTHLEDFAIDEENNRIIILGYPSTVYVYDIDGNYILQKQFMSLPVWKICSYKDGFICSSNHQSFSTKNESLIFFLDKDFNLKSEMGKTLTKNTLPPFISCPFFKDGKGIYYFDNLNSTMHLINTTNPKKSESINFVFRSPIPMVVLSEPQNFIANQENYCFFINAFLSNNILWAWFANQGTPCILVMDLKNKKQILAKYNSWFPEKMTDFNGYFYASMSVDWILEEKIIANAKNVTQYPIDYDSNPVILKFKPKQILE
jgi:hypothetical protein